MTKYKHESYGIGFNTCCQASVHLHTTGSYGNFTPCEKCGGVTPLTEEQEKFQHKLSLSLMGKAK